MFWKKEDKFAINKLPKRVLTQINNFYKNNISSEEFELFILNFEEDDFAQYLIKFNMTKDSLVKYVKKERKKVQSRRNFLKFGAKATAMGIGMGLGLNPKNTSEKENSYIFDLFKRLNKISSMAHSREPIFLSDLYPTIIIVGDVHAREVYGGSELKEKKYQYFKKNLLETQNYVLERDETWIKEFKQLEILRRECGLELVGLEGLSQEFIGKKHGAFLNGEEDLILNLLDNKQYQLVPLEDYDLQTIGIRFQAWAEFLKDENKFFLNENLFNLFLSKFYNLNLKNNSLTTIPEELIVEIMNLANSQYKTSLDSKNMRFAVLGWFRGIYWLKKLFTAKDGSKVIINYTNFKIMYEYLANDFNSLSDFYASKYYFQNLERDKFAVKKILGEMEKQNKKIAAIVFGINHIDNLIKELKKQTDNKVNIYVAK